MTAYVVVHINKTDVERFEEYQKGVIRTSKPFKGWILGAGEAKLLEGSNDLKNHNVILSFPTEAHAQGWWDSQDYRGIVPIRRESSIDAECMLLPGMDVDSDVSSVEHYQKKSVEVLGKRMKYVETGEGDPIVFLHGNPTSSYLWRNIIPHVEGLGRCIAPDLIGMGDSDKLDNVGEGSYRFFEHRKYLDAFLEKIGVTENVTLVIHDWGSALGFDWANRHREAVRGISYMEAMVAPFPNWDVWVEPIKSMFQAFRSPKGEEMILEKNMFVEKILTGAVMRKMGDGEMLAYRRPFIDAGENRRPTLVWPQELPVGGEPADMHKVFADYSEWLGNCDVPKLFVDAEPGAILRGTQRDLCRTWPNQTEVTVKGLHYIQEDSPVEIGEALAKWIPTLPRR